MTDETTDAATRIAEIRELRTALRGDAHQVLFEVHPEVFPGAVGVRLSAAADAISYLLQQVEAIPLAEIDYEGVLNQSEYDAIIQRAKAALSASPSPRETA